jgi:hypothetical protein
MLKCAMNFELASFVADIKDNSSSGAFQISSIDSVPVTTTSQRNVEGLQF